MGTDESERKDTGDSPAPAEDPSPGADRGESGREKAPADASGGEAPPAADAGRPPAGVPGGEVPEHADPADIETPPDGADGESASEGAPVPAVAEARKKVPIVAIGASAGGLEALQAFFSKVPPDSGIGFVVITHVRPGRQSILPELLENVASIPVSASEDAVKVEPNRAIVAKDSLLRIDDGVLYSLTEDDEPQAVHHPVDWFFRSLADDQQEHAICIVLSGSGNDGAIGLRAVKAAGGMVMVQQPETAKYAGMPDSALATRLADYVLPPERLPEALIEYCRGPFLRAVPRRARPELPEDAVQSILVRLRSHSGQDFTCYKRSTMSRRIRRRMNVHHIDDPREYLRHLRENPAEMDALLQELLISVTNFFRDGEAFDALADNAVPRLLEQRDDGHLLRVWVPGCATGEEAYSVAILLHEQVRRRERLHEIQMFATDLDARAIEVARGGLYPEGVAADISPERLKQYFTKEDGSYRIHKNIRDMIVFAVQNVISDPPFTRMDLIVCRNLLIYLDAVAQQEVLRAFHYALQPGGLLFLGSSETPGEAGRLFTTVDNRHKILLRRETPQPTFPAAPHPPRRARRPEAGPAAGEGRDEAGGLASAAGGPAGARLSRTIERALLDRFAPCSAVTDEHGTVSYIHGQGGMYFQPEQGQPRNDILRMAREGLALPLASALREAAREGRQAVRRGLRVRTNGEHVRCDLTVRPLTSPASLRGLLLVTLAPAEDADGAEGDQGDQGLGPAPAPGAGPAEREDIERELRCTRESLQSTVEELETSNEELRSSNEELQSTNEELQSANEELETSKEEMQSLNEELNTVNAELESKVDALARSNDDMSNLLNSMQVATIFLDGDLRVKRYTERARDVVRLIDSDIGRPLSDLTSTLDYPDLVEDCRKVLATLSPVEREARDADGRWQLVRLLPYRTADNVIDGLVLTVVDITRTKGAESDYQAALAGRDLFRGIVETVRQPLLVLHASLEVVLANAAFHRTFRTHAEDTDGRALSSLGDGQWDLPELRELLEDVLPEDNAVSGYRVEGEFPWIGRRAFLVNARRLRPGGDRGDMILLAFEDVTGREP